MHGKRFTLTSQEIYDKWRSFNVIFQNLADEMSDFSWSVDKPDDITNTGRPSFNVFAILQTDFHKTLKLTNLNKSP
jgi:hypothetical protein